MALVTLENLARYDGNAKDRAKSLYASASAANWQKTEKAGAVTCWPVPETDLEPVVEFLFTETLPEGTKGPGNPSTITGVSEVKATRCGKNLLAVTFNSATRNGLTYTRNVDGSVTISGTATQDTYFNFGGAPNPSESLRLKGVYTLSGAPNNPENNYRFVCFKDGLSSSGENGSGVSFSLPSKTSIWFSFFVKAGFPGSGNTVTFRPQLELGSTATAFEPYDGADYTIDLGSTFYGGTLDVASGKLTVTHRMVEPSSGTVDIADFPAKLPLDLTDTYGRTVTSVDGTSLSVGSSGGQIVYKLAVPYSVYIDAVKIPSLPALDIHSPRLNTIYTDALNVQVGYQKHPRRTEEEIQNAILALGGNV